MKSILLATTVLMGLSSGAYGADVISEAAPIAASFDWTGAYIGVNAGGGFGKFKFEPSLGTGLDITASGFLGGVQAGYNWQSGQIVYGVEADFQGSTVKSSISGFGGDIETKIDWFGTVRARIGYTPVDRFLVYGTGGFAYGHDKTSAGGGFSFSKTKAGWTVGGALSMPSTRTGPSSLNISTPTWANRRSPLVGPTLTSPTSSTPFASA